MGWWVGPSSPEEHRVVAPHPDARTAHQRRQAHRSPHVVGEREERRAERPGAAVEGDAVDDRAHAVLTHPVADVAAGAIGGGEVAGILDQRLGGPGQVGVTGEQIGAELGELLDDVARHRPGGDLLARGVGGWVEVHRRRLVVGEPAGGELRLGGEGVVASRHPGRPRLPPPLHGGGEEPTGLVGDLERGQVPPQPLPHQGNLVLAERRSVCGGGVLPIGAPVADVRLARDQRRAPCLGAGVGDRLVHRQPVVPVDRGGVPSVGGEPGRHVLGERPRRRALQRDLVVVVEQHEPAQRQVTGQGCRLRGDPLHHVPVGDEAVGRVIDQLGAEHRPQPLLGHRHPHRGAESLSERPGRGLDAEVALDLGVARGGRAELTEVGDVLDVEPEPGQMEHGVEQHRAVTVRHDEPVPIGPLGVVGVDHQVTAPQRDGDVRHPHRHPGMTGVRFLDRVDRQEPDGVGRQVCLRAGEIEVGHATPTGRRRRTIVSVARGDRGG